MNSTIATTAKDAKDDGILARFLTGILSFSIDYIVFNHNAPYKGPPSLLKSVRMLTSVTLFFGYCFQYMLKINLSIGERR
jgi:hypothetical protein